MHHQALSHTELLRKPLPSKTLILMQINICDTFLPDYLCRVCIKNKTIL